MHDDHGRMIDDEIDAVARSLTASSPSPALRSAVRSRIAGTAGPGYVWRWSLGAVAAAAVIGIALVWPGREAPVATPASREAISKVEPPAATERSSQLGSAERRSVVGRASPKPVGEGGPGSPGEPDTVRPTNAEPLPDGPLASLGPIVVEPLAALDPLGLNGIEIHTLTVEALSLEPLSLQ